MSNLDIKQRHTENILHELQRESDCVLTLLKNSLDALQSTIQYQQCSSSGILKNPRAELSTRLVKRRQTESHSRLAYFHDQYIAVLVYGAYIWQKFIFRYLLEFVSKKIILLLLYRLNYNCLIYYYLVFMIQILFVKNFKW